MPPDLPAELVAELLDWVACDRCDGAGEVDGRDIYKCAGEECTIDHWTCPEVHVVVTYQGRRVHADPERTVWWCAEHNTEVFDAAYSVRCVPVLRPVVPLDLEEA